MRNINKISFHQIKNILNKNNLENSSEINENEYFESLNSLVSAGINDLTFFSNENLTEDIINTNAKAILINKKNKSLIPINTKPIYVENPYKAFAIISNLFMPQNVSNGIISTHSDIHNSSTIKNNVQIDSFSHIKENCEIHDNVIIESNCTIGPNVIIEKNTIIKSHTRLLNSNIGSNCIIKSGAVIGGTGFGFDLKSKNRIQHFGNVIIENNCNIGSNTTIDRAVFDSTIISKNCFIDNLVQIAHNVILGKNSIIAAQTGIAGSTVIGENAIIGGQSGISGHLLIGNNVKIGAKSGVTKNIKDNSTVAGFPAIDIKKWKLINIKLSKL